MDIEEILEQQKKILEDLDIDFICEKIISERISYKRKRREVISEIRWVISNYLDNYKHNRIIFDYHVEIKFIGYKKLDVNILIRPIQWYMANFNFNKIYKIGITTRYEKDIFFLKTLGNALIDNIEKTHPGISLADQRF